jgi:cytochrome c551
VEGERLYGIYCANCHQKDGTGLARLYPPLKNSDYMLVNRQKVLCGMRYGQQGAITVNGVVFNQPMPANPSITDLEIAEIATYIYTVFADSVQIITANEVKASWLNVMKIPGIPSIKKTPEIWGFELIVRLFVSHVVSGE